MAMVNPQDRNIILIVDDDPDVGNSLRLILQKAGFEVKWVPCGKDGIRFVEQEDLAEASLTALIDVRLPDMKGLEVLKTLKGLDENIGAIMITGHTDLETAIGALNEGAFAYIQKPYNIPEVKASIARLLEKQKLIRENRILMRKMVELNNQLEKRVQQRTKDLQATNLRLADTIEKLRESDAAKSMSISMVSHEFRTPLTVIIGYAQTCLNQLEKLDKEALKGYLGLIQSNGITLSKLIESILDLSRIGEKGITLNLEKFDMEELAKSVVENLKVLRNNIHFDLRFEAQSREITSDRDRVRQILMNLLGNAMKYSPDSATVRVEGALKSGHVEISVSDSGPGIPQNEWESIFEPFYRGKDDAIRKTSGIGLGLTITKAIVEALQGRISLESTLGQGSKFSISLPVNAASASRLASVPEPK